MDTRGVPTRLALVAVGNTSTLAYTAPTGSRVVIEGVIVSNTTAGALTFRLCLTSIAAGNSLGFYDYSIAANNREESSVPIVLNSGEAVYCQGSATGLTLVLSGSERM